MLQEGDTAPDFSLAGYGNGEIETFSLTDALEKGPVILTFYIYDYSPVCTDQVCEVNDMEFITFNDEATVFGISTDGPYSHREFATDKDLSYPLLTDDGKHVYEQYGLVATNEDGKEELRRGIVVVDRDQTVRYSWMADGNWDEWTIEPLEEANAVIRELVDGDELDVAGD